MVTKATRLPFGQVAAGFFGTPSRAEFFVAAFFLALLVAFKFLNILHQAFDRDEPQHLHVVWELTRGLVIYRDFFDNHMPLFHILFAPLVGLFGERPTLLYWARALLFPMYLVVLWSTYQIGVLLFSRRAGLWAAIGLGLFRGYASGIEFRTDNLLVPAWSLCVLVLIRGSINPRRAAAAGMLLGLCFGVSMKSITLLLALIISSLLTAALCRDQKSEHSPAYLLRCSAAFLGSAFLTPGIIMLFFAAKHLWRDFQYAVFEFNFMAGPIFRDRLFYRNHPGATVLTIALFGGAAVCAALWIKRLTPNPSLAARRLFILILGASYFLLLEIFWPPTSRTYPPLYPFVFVMVIGVLLELPNLRPRSDRAVPRFLRLAPLPILVVSIEIVFLFLGKRSPFDDRTRHETDMLRSVLRLTEPGDYVLDCKGETVFRHRCVRPILERISMKAMQRGIMPDNAPERCVETRTCVVSTIWMQRYQRATREFVERNYLPVGHKLSVAGTVLTQERDDPSRYDFDVVISAPYQVIAGNATPAGVLDGVAYAGARFLTAGHHTFQTAAPLNGKLVLLWSRAVEQNFRPTTIYSDPSDSPIPN
jgi:Dolichyl-phosphate-mannose-protein mannosyltransferase